MSDALKKIENTHSLDFEGDCPLCGTLGGVDACDVVELARTLARLAHQDECGCDDHLSPDCCATVVPGDCPTCEAERALAKVAGEGVKP